jgi:hypothetical protein
MLAMRSLASHSRSQKLLPLLLTNSSGIHHRLSVPATAAAVNLRLFLAGRLFFPRPERLFKNVVCTANSFFTAC